MEHNPNQYLRVEDLPKTIDITDTLEGISTNIDDVNDQNIEESDGGEDDIEIDESDNYVGVDYLQSPYEELGQETSSTNFSQPQYLNISADSSCSSLQLVRIRIPSLTQDKLRIPENATEIQIRIYEDAVARKRKIMDAMLNDCDFYADGMGTNQNESLHHVRLPFIGYKFKHFKFIVSRINEADLYWNEGRKYVIEAFRRQNIALSSKAVQFFERLDKEDEQQRRLNLTTERRKYLASRKQFIRNRASATQMLDDEGYTGDNQESTAKKKRKMTVVPEEEQCTFFIVKKNQKCNLRIASRESKSAKMEGWKRDGKTLGKFCTIHMEEGCKLERIPGW